ncbi:ABC transporter permease [Parablautia intestinalis]|uniref:ABC transporter permease n=1 Tax=Parablautia intestinalis TaxID=2320100 RepID=A0A3A9ARS6_9FIRM|nr:ABC transporter permease [Parablautia intestinalis]RKI90291.1 ABC transporter permease [Parablautia intestinalis]
MKNTLRQVFHSPKFVIGFSIFAIILLTVIIYPLVVIADPLEMVGNGNFFKPGTYVSVKDAVEGTHYTLNIDVQSGSLDNKISADDKADMKDWLVKYGGVAEADVDINDTEGLIELWGTHYDPDAEQKGILASKKKYYVRLNNNLKGILEDSDLIIAKENSETGELEQANTIASKEFVNTKDVANRKTFILGTDNFGRDVLTELLDATKTSLRVGLIAGVVATLIGLFLGLLSGYLGGMVDNIITFVTNLFTVIPSFILLILISYSVGQAARGVNLVATIIGLTSWTWTTRSVRSQVISLRNRDHVNLSKLSGHSMMRIVLTDILPYIASYVVMAFILQISSGILAEAQLSMLGLGPSTSTTATLGLMMNWANLYAAPLNGSWWAYFPVVIMIALISFSLNLMNTGLDQIFNPQLRD